MSLLRSVIFNERSMLITNYAPTQKPDVELIRPEHYMFIPTFDGFVMVRVKSGIGSGTLYKQRDSEM